MKAVKTFFVLLMVMLMGACGPATPDPGASGPDLGGIASAAATEERKFAGDFSVWPLTVYVGECPGKETKFTLTYKPYGGADLAKLYAGKIYAFFTPYNTITKTTYGDRRYELTWDPESAVFRTTGSTMIWPDLTNADVLQSRVEVTTEESTTPRIIFTYKDTFKAGYSSLVQLIQCSRALALSCPASVEMNAASASGTVVDFAGVTQSGGCSPVTTACNPPVGSTFPVGVTTVNCTAADSCAAKAACSFNVTVKPLPPVTIGCPADVSIYATSTTGEVVSYEAPLTGGGCNTPMIVCSPPSGSSFPLGSTSVNCKASDSCGSESACKFLITVFAPQNTPNTSCSQYAKQTSCEQNNCKWIPPNPNQQPPTNGVCKKP